MPRHVSLGASMFNSVRVRRLTAVAGVAMLAACASSGASRGGSPAGDRYTITAAELTNAGADNLYQAIEKLRPDFFRQRGNTMAAGPQVGGSRGGSPAPEQNSNTAN